MSAGADSVGESRRRGFGRNEAKHAFAYTHSDTETHTGVYSDPTLPEWAALAHPHQSSTIIGGHRQPGREYSWAVHEAWGGEADPAPTNAVAIVKKAG
jgi:hypothetical protein